MDAIKELQKEFMALFFLVQSAREYAVSMRSKILNNDKELSQVLGDLKAHRIPDNLDALRIACEEVLHEISDVPLKLYEAIKKKNNKCAQYFAKSE